MNKQTYMYIASICFYIVSMLSSNQRILYLLGSTFLCLAAAMNYKGDK